MWVIISGDGDIDYTAVHGPFSTEEEANAAFEFLPPDDDDIRSRIKKIQAPETLASYYE